MPLTREDAIDDVSAFATAEARWGLPPTIREFMLEAGHSSTSVAKYRLSFMKDLGFARRYGADGASRAWRLTDAGRKAVEETA